MTIQEKGNLELLKKAVEKKNYVKFKYKDGKERLVAPYIIGEFLQKSIKIKETEPTIGMRAYFISGYTSKPIKTEMNKCKKYIIKDMNSVEIIEASDKSNKNNYNGEDKDFEIYFKRSVY